MPNRNIVGTGSAEYVPLSNISLSNNYNIVRNNSTDFIYYECNWMDHIYNTGDISRIEPSNNDLITLYLTNKFPYKNRKEIDTLRKEC